jgi:ribonuclease HI
MYYAVAKGKSIGIFSTWEECKRETSGYKGAIFKKFKTQDQADQFLHDSTLVEEIDEFTSTISIPFIPEYYVYTDGACINNGKDNAKAGIGIYFGENDDRNVSEQIEGKQTNNCAELMAVIKTYHIIKNDIIEKKIMIVTDSEYVIKCVTSYGKKNKDKNWEKDIPNKELVKELYELYENKPNVQFNHIVAHTNNIDIHSIGNKKADMLANLSIGQDSCPYQK